MACSDMSGTALMSSQASLTRIDPTQVERTWGLHGQARIMTKGPRAGNSRPTSSSFRSSEQTTADAQTAEKQHAVWPTWAI